MRKNQFKRFLSWILAAAIMVQMAPLQALAVSDEPILPVDEDGAPIEILDNARSEDAYIVGELMDERGEYEKRFQLSDGTFISATYQSPVHYEQDGVWLDINNTLRSVESNGRRSIRAANGSHAQSFSPTLADGTILTTTDGENSLIISLWDGRSEEELNAEEPEEEVQETQEEAEPAQEEAAEQEEVPAEPEPEATPATEETAQSMAAMAEPRMAPAQEEAVTKEAPPADEPEEETPETEEIEPAVEPEVEQAANQDADTEEEPEAPQEAEPTEETQLPAFNREATAKLPGNGPARAPAARQQQKSATDVIPSALQSTVTYENIYPNVDLKYDLFSYNIKESIILNSIPAEDGAPTRYTFQLQLEDLVPTLQEDGSIRIADEDGAVQYTIPAPYMMDDAGEYSQDVAYTLEEQEDGWLLTVLPDVEWLQDESRVYPVTIDPTILSKENQSGFVGGTATEYFSSRELSKTQMACGYHSNGPGRMEMYFKIADLPKVPDGCTVVDAVVGLNMVDYIPRYNGNAKMTMEIHQVTEARTGTDWLGDLTWATKPAYGPSMDFVTVSGNDIASYQTWDITRAAKEWYEHPETNYGLAVTGDQDGTTAYRAWFGYSSTAVVILAYRNTTGIESYYTYDTQSAGRAGTGYVGDYSSQLTVLKPILSYPNTAYPFSLSMVYNSALSAGELNQHKTDGNVLTPDFGQMQTGKGWQLSCQE